MHKARRIFVISDFKNQRPSSVFTDDRRIVKGLVRLGHDVLQFSYRDMLTACCPFPGKRIAQRFGKKKTNAVLLKMLKYYYPDFVFALNMKDIDAETAVAMRDTVPGAVFVGKDGDPFPENFPKRIETGKQMDIMTMTNGGRFLRAYKDSGAKCCAFVPNCCDPDTQYKYTADEKWQTDIVFSGKAEHKRLDREEMRYDIVSRLSKMPNARLYGCFGRPPTQGLDCFRSLSNAKIGLSINTANDVYLYHSDRYTNTPACGTFTLAKRAPGSELLFEDGLHMKYFDTAEEFFDLAGWYLGHEQEREKIAMAGMKRAHDEFNCQRIAGLLVNLAETGTYDASWAKIM